MELLDILVKIAIFAKPVFIFSIILFAIGLIICAGFIIGFEDKKQDKYFRYNEILTYEKWKELLKEREKEMRKLTLKYVGGGIACIIFIMISVSFICLPYNILGYQKYQIQQHYVSLPVAQEKLEPILVDYLSTIRKQLEDPKFTIEIKKEERDILK